MQKKFHATEEFLLRWLSFLLQSKKIGCERALES